MGSSPRPSDHFIMKQFKHIQLRWNEKLGEPECPYMTRYVLNLYFFAIRLHIWKRSDDKRYMHDHPFSFLSIVLKGSYTDVSPKGKDKMNFLSVRYRKAEHRHYVHVSDKGCTTLLITSKPFRNWGFYVHNRTKLLRPLRFFSRYGHPPCDDD